MEYCIINDDMAAFVIGMSRAEWDEITSSLNEARSTALGFHKELGALTCDITYIKSLPSGSISQTQALS